MTPFLEFFNNAQHDHVYKLKLAIPADQIDMDRLETYLKKYDVVNVSSPNRVPIQRNPIDFSRLTNSEVNVITITTKIPMSPTTAIHEIMAYLDVPQDYIVFRSENDPAELIQDFDPVSATSIAGSEHDVEEVNGVQIPVKKGYKLNIGEEAKSPKGEPKYGDAYNTNFIKALEADNQARAKRLKSDRGPAAPKAKTTNDLPQNTKSPVIKSMPFTR